MTENEQVAETGDGAQFKIQEFNGSVNSERAIKQVRTPIRVIVGNPPYSVGQDSENDNNQNLNYPTLDEKIRQTYAARSTATLKRNLYDSYVRAIRWASDRIGDHGIIAFVTNAGFIDGNAMDGLRATFADEFSSIWVFNARGNQSTSGETSRKEGGKLFGSGSRAPIALTLFAKIPEHQGSCNVQYFDIGDYLTRDQKLEVIRDAKSVKSVPWMHLSPNEQHDWINQRDPAFDRFSEIETDSKHQGIFVEAANGVITSRDSWTYNSSQAALQQSIETMCSTFNDHAELFTALASSTRPQLSKNNEWVTNDPTLISWSRSLRKRVQTGRKVTFATNRMVESMYRPFFKQWFYLDRDLLEVPGRTPSMIGMSNSSTRLLYSTGTSASKTFSVLMIDRIPNYHLLDSGRAYPKNSPNHNNQPISGALFDLTKHVSNDNGINDFMLEQYRQVYDDPSITKEDIFYYVYGVLHSPEYRTRFEADLKKMLPRIPFTADFWAFSNAGRGLGDLHVGYESVEPWPITETRKQMPFASNGQQLDDRALYRVEKMRFGKDGRKEDRSVILYNNYLTLSNIPLDAYDYIVNGKSALEWILERYAVTQDKESKIVNDPNDWSDDPRYIIDLVKRIVRVSLETNRIVATLPALNERDVVISPSKSMASMQ